MNVQQIITYMEHNAYIADEVTDMCIEALKKQEAKKPRIKKALGITIMECPCCEKTESYIGSGVFSKYCPECGQKLDWGD